MSVGVLVTASCSGYYCAGGVHALPTLYTFIRLYLSLSPSNSRRDSLEPGLTPDNDISGGSFGIRQVKSTLSGAYQILQAKLFERAAQMSRKNWRNEAKDPVELSLLTAVMGVTKEVSQLSGLWICLWARVDSRPKSIELEYKSCITKDAFNGCCISPSMRIRQITSRTIDLRLVSARKDGTSQTRGMAVALLSQAVVSALEEGVQRSKL
jgi:hypothetical protein